MTRGQLSALLTHSTPTPGDMLKYQETGDIIQLGKTAKKTAKLWTCPNLPALHVRKVTDVTARIRTWASHFPGECANHYTTVTAQRAESDLCAAPFRPTITCGISRLYRI